MIFKMKIHKFQHNMGMKGGHGSTTVNQKWVDERKRKFPSQVQQNEKLVAQEERVKRGELVHATNKFGTFQCVDFIFFGLKLFDWSISPI